MYRGRVIAGIFIGLSTLAYLCIGGIFGAAVFSFGFLGILYSESEIYEMKALWLGNTTWKELLGIILCNLVGISLVALMARGSGVGIKEAESIISGHLDTPILRTFLMGTMSGIGMGMMMWVYRKKESVLFMILGIVLVLSCSLPLASAELMCVLLAGVISWRAFLYIILVLFGYSIGGVFRKIITPDEKR